MRFSDWAYAGRTLRRNPSFTLTAVLILALGIGLSTAIFSVANAVLLRPLPYTDADRLVTAWVDYTKPGVRDVPLSNTAFLTLRDATTGVFDDLAGVFTFRVISPREDGRPERTYRAEVTTNFFRLTGARIVMGRDFTAAEGRAQPFNPNAGVPPGSAAILSFAYWQRRYGANPSVIGHELGSYGQRGPIIVGVLAPGFELFFPPQAGIEARPDVWIANNLGSDPRIIGLRAMGKLKHGASLKQAQERVELVASDMRARSTFDASSGLYIRLEPMHRYLVSQARPVILALMGAVLFLLVIACSNVASLFLVRMSLRARELAVRAAIGGSRWRIACQLLTEAVLLSGLGTVAGLGVAWLGIRELLAVAPVELPRIESAGVDWRVLIFATAAGLFTTVVFGLLPAWNAARPRVMDMLRDARSTPGKSAGVLRNATVVVEVALSFVLLAGSGLMLRSFANLQRIDPGYNPRGVLTFLLVRDWDNSAPAETRLALLRTIQERLKAVPNVKGVTAFPFVPLTGGFSGAIDWSAEGMPAGPPGSRAANLQSVLPGYFETLRTPVIEGRTFEERDNSPGHSVAVVDQLLAAKAFPNQSAVGKRIRLDFLKPPWVEVVGVVAHQRLISLAEPGREQIFLTDGLVGFGVGRYWAIRTGGDPASIAPAVRDALAKLDRQLLMLEIKPMEAIVTGAEAGTRFSLLLIGVFAGVSAFLAAMGVYGVLSTSVRQRTREIGVRMALGAAPGDVFRLVTGLGLRLAGGGLLIGVAAAFGVTRLLIGMLVAVTPADPLTFAVTLAVSLAVSGFACGLPAWRAAGMTPAEALRE